MNLAYSTGLIENVSPSDGVSPYPFFVVRVTNNNRSKRFKAKVILYSAPRKRRKNISILTIRPLSSLSASFDISQLSQFQIDMITMLGSYDIQVSIFWKDANRNLIPYQKDLDLESAIDEDMENESDLEISPESDLKEKEQTEPELKPNAKKIALLEPEPTSVEEVKIELDSPSEEEAIARIKPELPPGKSLVQIVFTPQPEKDPTAEIKPEPQPRGESTTEIKPEPQTEEKYALEPKPESPPEKEQVLADFGPEPPLYQEKNDEPEPEDAVPSELQTELGSDSAEKSEPTIKLLAKEEEAEEMKANTLETPEIEPEIEEVPEEEPGLELQPEAETLPAEEPEAIEELKVEEEAPKEGSEPELQPEAEAPPAEEAELKEEVKSKVDKEGPLPKKLEPVKIGAIYPFSGAYSLFGERIRQAVDLAAEFINNYYNLPLPLAQSEGLSNLKNRKIAVIWADSQGSPSIGRMEAKRLVEEEGAVALLGCFQSDVTAMASLQAEIMQIPFLNPESPSASLTQRGFKWFFRTCPDDVRLTQLYFDMFTFLKENGIEISPLAILSEDSPPSVEATALEINLGRSLNMWLALEMYHDLSESLQAEMNRLFTIDPRIIISHQQLPGIISVIENLKSLNRFPEGLLAQNTNFILPDLIDQIGKEANYVISRAAWAIGLGEQKPLVNEVNTLYKDKYNQDLDEVSAQSFTGILVLADAVNRARNTNPIDIRNALARTYIRESRLIMPWQGIEFDQNGQNVLTGSLLTQIIAQQAKIIWPLEMAETELVWPAPSWDER